MPNHDRVYPSTVPGIDSWKRRTMNYATPRNIEHLEDCRFYHYMDLPGIGLVEGTWDLRDEIDNYLGGLDYSGQRVLDMGTASGYLTFEMENRGADVVSYDITEGQPMEIVPYMNGGFNLAAAQAASSQMGERTKNAYWFAHRLLGSRARAYYGDIRSLPVELGKFDVALFGMILGHLRDPFGALCSVARLAPSTIVITNQTHPDDDGGTPLAYFMPSTANREPAAYWALSIGCLTQMLDILDYEVEDVRSAWPWCRGIPERDGREHCSSIIARRR